MKIKYTKTIQQTKGTEACPFGSHEDGTNCVICPTGNHIQDGTDVSSCRCAAGPPS